MRAPQIIPTRAVAFIICAPRTSAGYKPTSKIHLVRMGETDLSSLQSRNCFHGPRSEVMCHPAVIVQMDRAMPDKLMQAGVALCFVVHPSAGRQGAPLCPPPNDYFQRPHSDVRPARHNHCHHISNFARADQIFSRQASALRQLEFRLSPRCQANSARVLRARSLDVAADMWCQLAACCQRIEVDHSAGSGRMPDVPLSFARGIWTLDIDAGAAYKFRRFGIRPGSRTRRSGSRHQVTRSAGYDGALRAGEWWSQMVAVQAADDTRAHHRAHRRTGPLADRPRRRRQPQCGGWGGAERVITTAKAQHRRDFAASWIRLVLRRYEMIWRGPRAAGSTAVLVAADWSPPLGRVVAAAASASPQQ